MTRRRRTEATSGFVRRRVKKGEKRAWIVRMIDRAVVKTALRGPEMGAGRYLRRYS